MDRTARIVATEIISLLRERESDPITDFFGVFEVLVYLSDILTCPKEEASKEGLNEDTIDAREEMLMELNPRFRNFLLEIAKIGLKKMEEFKKIAEEIRAEKIKDELSKKIEKKENGSITVH